jgi:hypothetical protein
MVALIGGCNSSDQIAKNSNEVAITAMLVRRRGFEKRAQTGPVNEALIPKNWLHEKNSKVADRHASRITAWRTARRPAARNT